MRDLIGIVFFLSLTVLFSCEEDGFFVECSECEVEEPVNTELDIQLDPPGISATIINIYEGNLEDNILMDTFTNFTLPVQYFVSLNKKYTITATYFSENKYTAVNSVTPRVRYSKEQCDDPCYYVYDRTVNLKLKYTK